MTGRAKRILIYTISLLTAPMPLMPYEKGTREFALALIACGVILTLSSYYVVDGETKPKFRPLIGNKLLATSLITLFLGMSLIVGSIAYLSRS